MMSSKKEKPVEQKNRGSSSALGTKLASYSQAEFTIESSSLNSARSSARSS